MEKINPGDPSSGTRVSLLFGDMVQSAPSGEQATRTIRVRDASGSFEVVSVETKKAGRTHPVQVQQTPAQQPKRRNTHSTAASNLLCASLVFYSLLFPSRTQTLFFIEGNRFLYSDAERPRLPRKLTSGTRSGDWRSSTG